MILRRAARPMLAAIFVTGGIATLRNLKPHVQAAEPVIDKALAKVRDSLPEQVPTDAETLVRLDAAAKIGAGIALALGKFARLSALLLAGSLVPTTIAAHRYWEIDDPAERAIQQTHFLKNVGLLGGLMLATADTHGKPSVAWHLKHATHTATHKLHDATDSARDTVRSLVPGT